MANDGHGADSSEDQDVPAVFKQVPPEWVPQTSNTADLGQLKSRNTNYMIFVTYNLKKGYINFFPPNPSRDEEALTETIVKHGYQSVVPFSVSFWT